MPPGVGDVVEGIDVSHVVNIRKVEVIDCVLTWYVRIAVVSHRKESMVSWTSCGKKWTTIEM